jgi:ribonuclease BN (tRNA processing enzyme)
MPKIIFLGTGGDAIAVGKHLRSAGGIILEVEGNQFHIDPGPGALAKAKEYGVNLRNNVAVLVSHNHMNHCNDINAVVSAMTHGGLDRKGVLVSNKTALIHQEGIHRTLTDTHRDMLERAIVLEPGQRVGINEIEVWATKAHHSDPEAIGFRFVTPHYVIGYTSDTGYNESLLKDFADVDVLIVNLVYPEDIHDDNQLNYDDAKSLILSLKPKLTILTHFGIKLIESDVLAHTRKLQKETKLHIIAAKDGMAVRPVSHSVSYRQKFQ